MDTWLYIDLDSILTRPLRLCGVVNNGDKNRPLHILLGLLPQCISPKIHLEFEQKKYLSLLVAKKYRPAYSGNSWLECICGDLKPHRVNWRCIERTPVSANSTPARYGICVFVYTKELVYNLPLFSDIQERNKLIGGQALAKNKTLAR